MYEKKSEKNLPIKKKQKNISFQKKKTNSKLQHLPTCPRHFKCCAVNDTSDVHRYTLYYKYLTACDPYNLLSTNYWSVQCLDLFLQ